MTKKEKQLRKENVKKVMFKGLNILCYVLSVIFILLMILIGLQSCNNKAQKVSAENESAFVLKRKNAINLGDAKYYTYISKFDGTYSFSSDVLKEPYNIDSGMVGQDAPTKYVQFGIENSKYISSSSNQLYDIDYFVCNFQPVRYNSVASTYYYQVTQASFLTTTKEWVTLFTRTSEYYIDLKLYFNSIRIILSEEITGDWIFNNWFYRYEQSDFIFNKQFNYNAPIGLSINNQFGGTLSMATQIGAVYRIIYDTGYFLSNDTLYNAIVIDYQNSGSLSYDFDGVIKGGQEDTLSYYALGYRRASDNLIDFVNYRDTKSALYPNTSSGVLVNVQLSSSTWINDNYRYVTFLQSFDDNLKVKINAFNNNNQTSYNGSVTSGDVTNVFTLVSGAFTGLLPILSIYILPNITLGMLIFVPLVALLVFAIIRIIKK